MKARSSAIRTALANYNAAAAGLDPPRQSLEWDQVVEYAFLADFDLLRDTRQDVRTRIWASPAARQAMDSYFKIVRAKEEIKRLNVEIRRFATYLDDERAFLERQEIALRASNPFLSHAVLRYRMERGRYDDLHRRKLNEIYDLKGFTGSRTIGKRALPEVPNSTDLPLCAASAEEEVHRPYSLPSQRDMEIQHAYAAEADADANLELQEEQEDEDDAIVALTSACGVLLLGEDGVSTPEFRELNVL